MNRRSESCGDVTHKVDMLMLFIFLVFTQSEASTHSQDPQLCKSRLDTNLLNVYGTCLDLLSRTRSNFYCQHTDCLHSPHNRISHPLKTIISQIKMHGIAISTVSVFRFFRTKRVLRRGVFLPFPKAKRASNQIGKEIWGPKGNSCLPFCGMSHGAKESLRAVLSISERHVGRL